MSTDPWSLSTTAASNSTIGGVSAAEGILPANLNNIDRALAAGLRELVKVIGGEITAGGTADALTVTTGLSWSAYAAGQIVCFEAASTNTGATTLAIDGLAAKAITDNAGSALTAGTITAGGFYICTYESGSDNFHILNPTVSTTTSVTAAAVMTDNAIVRGDGGSRGVQTSVVLIDDTTGTLYLSTTDTGALGSTTKMWGDLFLADGAVINFNNGNVTITHSAGALAFSVTPTVGGSAMLLASAIGSTVQAYDADTAKLDTAQEWTGRQNFNETALTSTSNSVAWDASTNQVATHTLTENTTVAAPTNIPAGSFIALQVIQHASAAKTLAWNTVFKWPGGVTPTMSTGLSAIDEYIFRSNGTNLHSIGVRQNIS